MSCFHNPSAGLEIWVSSLFLNLFVALLHMRNVIMLFDNLLGRFTSITLISAKMLHNVVGTVDHYLIENYLKLRDVMSVRPGYDNR